MSCNQMSKNSLKWDPFHTLLSSKFEKVLHHIPEKCKISPVRIGLSVNQMDSRSREPDRKAQIYRKKARHSMGITLGTLFSRTKSIQQAGLLERAESIKSPKIKVFHILANFNSPSPYKSCRPQSCHEMLS